MTDRIPDDIVDWVRDADVCELDALAGLVHKEMQVRADEMMLSGNPEVGKTINDDAGDDPGEE